VRRARVALADPDHELAVIEIATPLPDATPLQASTAPLERGATVLTFAAPGGEGKADAVTPGTITRVTGDRFLASARVAFHPSWGSPLVDCEGRVVGAAAGSFGDEGIRVSVLGALAERAPTAPEYSPGWSIAHPAVGMQLSYGGSAPWVGGYLGTSLVNDDRLELSLHGGVLARADMADTRQPSYDLHQGIRVLSDMRVGYRMLLDEGFFPIYLVPSLGAVGGWETRWRTSVREQITGTTCSPGAPCAVERTSTNTSEGSRLWLAPVVGTALRIGPLEVGYSLELDVRHPKASMHSLMFGVQL